MSYFRKLAKLLHPDKNNHPMAKEAFQKFSEAVQVVSSSPSSHPKQSSSCFWKYWTKGLFTWVVHLQWSLTSFKNELMSLDKAIIRRDLPLNTKMVSGTWLAKLKILFDELKTRYPSKSILKSLKAKLLFKPLSNYRPKPLTFPSLS